MASQKAVTKPAKSDRVKVGTYFVWGNKLWYVMDISSTLTDADVALLENCYTDELSWVEVRFFKNKMKEVKLKNARNGSS